MSDSFDAYFKWLSIPPEEQPPNHYRLLGVPLFATDVDVISHAADRQMSHLRTFQVGTHSALSQKLLNEISTARITLLNAQKKAAYDEQLRASLAALKPVAPQQVAASPAPVRPVLVSRPLQQPALADPLANLASEFDITTSPAHAKRKPRARGKSMPWQLPVVAVGALAVLALAAVVFKSRAPSDPVAQRAAPQSESPQAKAKPSETAEPELPPLPAKFPAAESPAPPTGVKTEPPEPKPQPAPAPPAETPAEIAAPLPVGSRFALDFNGNTKGCEVSNFQTDITQTCTFEVWVRPGPKLGAVILLYRPSGGVSLWRSDNNSKSYGVQLDHGAGGTMVFDTKTPIVAGRWTHLAVTFDPPAADIVLYIDGLRKVSHKTGVQRSWSKSSVFSMGSHGFQGALREIRVSRGLRYTEPFTPEWDLKCDGQTVALYHCATGQGDVLFDACGTQHGKIGEAQWLVTDSPPPAAATPALPSP